MRINAGIWKGRNLFTLRGNSTRPTSDMVKQAIFNILQGKIKESIFCDLFAGTGNIGFEALSRGAKHVTFVENNRDAIDIINKNAVLLGCTDDIKLMCRDASNALGMMQGNKFDIIFSDAPYSLSKHSDILNLIESQELLSPGGIIVIQRAYSKEVYEMPDSLYIYDKRKYGITSLEFIKAKE